MKNKTWFFLCMALLSGMASCSDGLLSAGNSGDKKMAKRDRGQQTVIDDAEYVDFTIKKYNARTIRHEDILSTLGSNTFKNGNSLIVIKAREGVIEISSDAGIFNGKKDCQIYGVFGFDIQAASDDCLYIRKNQQKEGFILIDGNIYRNDAMPDLATCLPLYGYSRNRIEVSSVMDGYIVMPSGTYWKR